MDQNAAHLLFVHHEVDHPHGQAFLDQQIRYTDIAAVVERTLERVPTRGVNTLATILADDAQARAVAGDIIAARMAGR